MKKYKLLRNDTVTCDGKTLFRIQSLIDIKKSDIRIGDLGGYIEKRNNLSYKGDCWIFQKAKVCGNAKVYGNAKIYGEVEVFDNAKIYGDAIAFGNSRIHGNAKVCGNARIGNGFVWKEFNMIQKLASIEKIISVRKHPTADSLSICKILGYEAITKLNQFKKGDLVIYIQPDCVLPDEEWAQFYRSKSNRTKAIKLRGEWSQGIIESLSLLKDCFTLTTGLINDNIIGLEVSKDLNITKYEIDSSILNEEISGVLPYGLFRSYEERWENIEDLPFGKECVVTFKIDGKSASYGHKTLENEIKDIFMCQHSYRVNPELGGIYAQIEQKYSIFEKLKKLNRDICIRGEIYGNGIQKSPLNPYCKLPLDFAVYNILDLNTLNYLPFDKVKEICEYLKIPHVPIFVETFHMHIRRNDPITCILSSKLIKYFSEEIQTIPIINNKIVGNYSEGVVIKFYDGSSFKVINKYYDSKK